MDTLTLFAIIAFAALIHASFQLSISVLTLLSGHALSKKQANARVVKLTTSFVIGVAIMTVFVLSFVAILLTGLEARENSSLVWAICCGLLVGVGVAVWLFYYRRERGTSLWIPRSMAAFLSKRTATTRQSAEAFSLGISSVVAELIFIIAPLAVAGFAIIHLEPSLQLLGIAIYTVISLFSLVAVWMLVGGGHPLSRIQKWREDHKHFLQFSAASGLIVLAFFVYVSEVAVNTVGASL